MFLLHYLFREAKSGARKTVSFEEQVMSKDKYPSKFSRQVEAIVFILQILAAQFWKLGNIWQLDYEPEFSTSR